jgi:hypothetical protein
MQQCEKEKAQQCEKFKIKQCEKVKTQQCEKDRILQCKKAKKNNNAKKRENTTDDLQIDDRLYMSYSRPSSVRIFAFTPLKSENANSRTDTKRQLNRPFMYLHFRILLTRSKNMT